MAVSQVMARGTLLRRASPLAPGLGQFPPAAVLAGAGARRAAASAPQPPRRSAIAADALANPADKAALAASLGKAFQLRVPSIEDAKLMPFQINQVSNEALYILAELGQHDACYERLVRNVMAVDDVDWLTAVDKVKAIDAKDREFLWLATLPYKVGIFTGLSCTIGAIPMVFHRPTVEVFNEHFVTTDVPEEKDLETALEIGSWAWNWVEPPMGVIGFMILSMQVVRAQMQNMGWKPYTDWVKTYRAERLSSSFPQYSADIVQEFSMSAPLTPSARLRSPC